MARYRNVTYDDRDKAFNYQSYWFNGTWNASSTGDSGTLASTNLIEANVTFVFPQAAKAFYYWGMRRSKGAWFGICIDCDPNLRNYETIDGLNATDDGKNPPSVLYSKVFETPGVHEIILKNLADTRFADNNNNSQLSIDRFDLEVETGEVESSSVAESSSSSSSSFGPTGAPNSADNGPSAGTIAGAVVGAVLGALLIILLAVFLFLRKRKRRQANSSNHSLSPFTADSTKAEQPPVMVQREVQPNRRETDAGRIDDEDGDILPPDYNQVFSPGTTDSVPSRPSREDLSTSLPPKRRKPPTQGSSHQSSFLP